MKKNLLYLLALSAMVMGGCSKSEIDEGTINSTNAITFETSANKLTKAPVLDNDNAKDFDFGVYGYYTGLDAWKDYTMEAPNFMYDQTVGHNGSAWVYLPIKYWPNTTGDKISFFAYMPKNDAVTSSVTGTEMPVINFKQKVANPGNMIDLTVAQAIDKQKTAGTVTLDFKHILTRLSFAAKSSVELDAATTVTVDGLRLLGTENSAGVDKVADNSGINDDSRFFSAATYALTGDDDYGTWSTEDATDDEPRVAKALDLKTILNSDRNITADAVKDLLADGEYLFLIPPYGKDGVKAESDVRFQVDYTVKTVDPTNDKNNTINSATAMFSMPNGSLVEGKAYRVIFTFDMNDVRFDVTVSDIEDEDIHAVVAGDAQSAEDIKDMITDAFADTKNPSEFTVNFDGNESPMNIDLSSAATTNLGMDIIINMPNQSTPADITIPANYTGAITIYAPNATVTAKANGTAYNNVTVTTAPNTFVIPEGVTVNNLTINGGNVQVYGTLNGDVVRGVDNTDTKTIITVMEGATYGGTTYEESDSVKVVKIDDLADGRYYSIDGGDWTSFSTADDITALGSSYTKIALMSKGDNTNISADMIIAFYQNENLLEWDLGKAYCTVNIGNTFVNKAQKLQKAVLPSGLTNIYENFFKGLTELEEVVLQDGVETIQSNCFKDCTSLSKIVLPASTTHIYQYAFSGCSSLENINLENVEIIDKYCFEKCNIKNLVLGDKLTTIGYYAFSDNLNLETTTLPASVKSENLGGQIFRNTNISTFSWPSSLEVLQANFFLNLKNLKSVVIPSTVTTIGQSAFNGSGIESITIPSSVKLFDGFWAFCNCNSLTEIIYEDGCQITTIPDGCFNGLLNIEEMVIPASITEIKNIGIWKCRKLSTIICKASTMPKVYEKSLGGIESTGVNAYNGTEVPAGTPKVLYVPANLVDTYKAETLDGEPITESTDVDGNVTTNENYWYTVLQKKCGFTVKSIDDLEQ